MAEFECGGAGHFANAGGVSVTTPATILPASKIVERPNSSPLSPAYNTHHHKRD
jgi:hypothetical protein